MGKFNEEKTKMNNFTIKRSFVDYRNPAFLCRQFSPFSIVCIHFRFQNQCQLKASLLLQQYNCYDKLYIGNLNYTNHLTTKKNYKEIEYHLFKISFRERVSWCNPQKSCPDILPIIMIESAEYLFSYVLNS